MSEQSSAIISKVWGMCSPLRDDGVGYGDYLEQLTYLIFLKMSDEYSKPPYKKDTGIPAGYGWSDMSNLKGVELEEKYKVAITYFYYYGHNADETAKLMGVSRNAVYKYLRKAEQILFEKLRGDISE